MPRKKGSMTKGTISAPELVEKGDNSKYLQKNLAFMEMGREKVDLDDYDEVLKRLQDFFQLNIEMDTKPTMTGMYMALGYDHKVIENIMNNLPASGKTGSAYRFYGHTTSSVPKEVRDLLNMAKDLMKSMWEDYMLNGKVHPACGIFIGKNYFGMRDVVENVVRTDGDALDEYSADDIAQRYLHDENG